jgi:hypothetical protein
MVNELARDAGYQTLDVYAQVADMVNVEVRTAFDQKPEAGGDSFFGVISSLLIPGAMIGEAFLGAQIRDELRE